MTEDNKEKKGFFPKRDESNRIGTLLRTSATWKKYGEKDLMPTRYGDERQLRHIEKQIRLGNRSAPRGWISLPLHPLYAGRVFVRKFLSVPKRVRTNKDSVPGLQGKVGSGD